MHQNTAAEVYAKGVQCLQSGDFSAAARCIEQAIALNPSNVQAFFNLGIAKRALSLHEHAIENFEKAISLDAECAPAYYALGVTLNEIGEAQKALNALGTCIEIAPNHALALFVIGEIFFDHQDHQNSREFLERYLEIEPSDSQGATMQLAALGALTNPETCGEAFLQHQYSRKAKSWDLQIGYKAHRIVANKYNSLSENRAARILDAGCGTGLVGEILGANCKSIEGVDICSEMLERASEKAIYSHLYCEEMTAFMLAKPACYDAVLSAATLIHFSDLSRVFDAVHRCLRHTGLFVFTVYKHDHQFEPSVSQRSDLAKGGCFSHSIQYIQKAAQLAKFDVVSSEVAIHEHGHGTTVDCYLIALRKRPI